MSRPNLRKLQKPASQGGVSIGAARLRQAREFIVMHPDMSRSQISAATGLSEATISRARRDLVAEGTIPAARNTPLPKRAPDPEPPEPEAAQPPEAKAPEVPPPPAKSPAPARGGNNLLDHQALLDLAKMVDEAIESGDDETIQKRLSKQALVFAFRTDLHPDTRMSASQMYYKLRDMAKAKDLGPGKPKTYAEAVRREADMMLACGPQMTMDAVHLAFDVKETPDGQASHDQAQPVGGPAQAPSPAGHPSDPAAPEVVRPIDVGVRGLDEPNHGLENPHLPGPPQGREGAPGDPRTTPHPHGDSPWG